MSQPLSGQVRILVERVQPRLKVHEGLFLMVLADLIHKDRNSITTDWQEMGKRLGIGSEWLRQIARRLKRRGILTITKRKYGVEISFVQDLLSWHRDRCSQHRSGKFETGVPNTVETGVPNTGLTAPLTIPQALPRKDRVSSSDIGSDSHIKEGGKRKCTPPSSDQKNGIHHPVSTSQRITLEREIQRLQTEITRIRAKDNEDRTEDERAKLKEFKVRVDLDCEQLGLVPIYRKRT